MHVMMIMCKLYHFLLRVPDSLIKLLKRRTEVRNVLKLGNIMEECIQALSLSLLRTPSKSFSKERFWKDLAIAAIRLFPSCIVALLRLMDICFYDFISALAGGLLR